MSTYDTFLDPATGEKHQSKAFGRGLRTYRPGDTVTPQRSPLSEDEYAEDRAGRWDSAIPGLEVVTCQVRIKHADGERYIDVADGIFTGISATRDPALPLIDHYGQLVDEAAPTR
ncbi:hypothetical protein CGZ95_08865 [Enemella evansiae]|uniref:hypothetical protein n=1 Tax=Enemella evansiae TaxID=2016499 RepID=UPI000B97AB2F|nr:hypothetical protein [Enemella evansiae]OYO00723.1 hypothetical protein CGZ95_08865 [Enemella evansiae]